jgi:hypothetical protein
MLLAQQGNRWEHRRLPKTLSRYGEPPAPLSSAPSQVLPECIQAELGVLPLKSLCEGFGLFRQHSPSNDLIESSPDALPVEERRWNWSRPELDVSQRPALNWLLSRSVKTTCSSPRHQHSLPSWFRLEYVIFLSCVSQADQSL